MATAVSTLASSSAGSRYRRLRGKSVSAPRAAFADIGGERADDSDSTFATATATRLKRRSKSVTAVDITTLRAYHNNDSLASPAGPLPTEPPPPPPAFPLHPRARAARPTRAHLSSTAEERDGDAAEADEEPRGDEEEEGEVVVQERPQRRKKSRADIIRQQILNKRSGKQNQDIAAGPSDSSGADSGSTTPISTAASTAAARGLTITTTGTAAAPPSASENLQQQQQHSADEHPPSPNEAEKTRTEEEQEAARLAARLEAETDRILAEQQKLDLHRLRAQLTAVDQTLSSPPAKGRSPVFEKFTFFGRGRRSNVSQATVSSTTATLSSPSSSHTASADYSFDTASSSLPSSPLAAMAASKLIWTKDAQISPSIRERRVAVQYLQSTIHLSVTAATTSVDVVFSSGNYMGRNIDPAACVVVERWRSLGLERRLRRYETIRDVLDGWDDDGQNALAIVDSDRVDEDVRLLAIEAAPRSDEPPAGFTFQLYHAQRHGRWLKKWITLLENGQMFASKRSNAARNDRDIATLCHLSDFDIYALGGGDDDTGTTAAAAVAATRKALKVTRRHCYAIKSMQRANLFQNGENYVHFFATDDADLAARFFDLVHQWRSWFIVNRKLPELRSRRQQQQQQQQPHRRLDDASVSPQIPISSTSFATVTHHHAHKTQKSISVVRSGGHALKVSVDESPYSIGAFAPLLDMDRFNKPIDEFGKDFLPAEKPAATHRAKEVPRPRNPAAANSSPASPLIRQEDPAGQPQFAAGGLLGAGYDVKVKKMAAAEKMIKSSSNAAIVSSASATAAAATNQGPFTPGNTLLSGTASASAAQVGKPGSVPVAGDDNDDDDDDKLEPASWFPSASEHSARQRARAPPIPTQRPERHVDPSTGQTTLLQPQRRPALPPRQQQQQHYHHQQGRSLLSNFPQPPAGAVSPAAADHHSALVVLPGLIDLITTTPPMPPIPAGPPPASQRDRGHGSVSRRPSTAGNGASAGAAGATRQRSKSTAGLGARPLNHNPHTAPPPPPMPRSTSRGGREGELERVRLVERERERQMMAGAGGPLQTPPLSRGGGGYQERPMMRGRSGTVRY